MSNQESTLSATAASISPSKQKSKTYSGTDVSKLICNSKLLIAAVKKGDKSLVRKLIDGGIPQSIRDQSGCSPLYHAALNNYVEIAEMLLETGNFTNVVTKANQTPLHVASARGHLEIVRILIANRADVNLVDSAGMTALHLAAENNHLEIVKILIEAGSDRLLVNKFGKTAQSLAFEKNNFEICKFLQELEANSVSEDILQLRYNSKRCEDFLTSDRESTFPEIPTIDQNLLQRNLRGQIKTELPSTSGDKKNEAMKLFEKHGIRLLPEDQSTVIGNALKHGQIAVLTEAGKLALKKTEPYIIRKIASMSNPPQIPSANEDMCRKSTIDAHTKNNPGIKRKLKDESSSKTKVIKIDAKNLVNLTTNKKLIINRQAEVSSTPADPSNVKKEIPSCCTKTNSNTEQSIVDNLKSELEKKSLLIKEMKNQVLVALRVAKHFKTKYEVKERQAALYKTQLINLTKFLSKSASNRIARIVS